MGMTLWLVRVKIELAQMTGCQREKENSLWFESPSP